MDTAIKVHLKWTIVGGGKVLDGGFRHGEAKLLSVVRASSITCNGQPLPSCYGHCSLPTESTLGVSTTKTPLLSLLIIAALALACGAPPAAEEPAAEESSSAAVAVREAALARLSALEGKYVGLAEAVPQDKYTWSPGEGVRSVSELFLHVASANYRLPNMIGTPPPEGMNFEEYEKSTTDQAEIVAALKASFPHSRKAYENVADGDLENAVKVFGRDSTNAGALITFNGHLSEYLGQGIAYARVNGVVPPWNQ